jgi:hypothetical protein
MLVAPCYVIRAETRRVRRRVAVPMGNTSVEPIHTCGLDDGCSSSQEDSYPNPEAPLHDTPDHQLLDDQDGGTDSLDDMGNELDENGGEWDEDDDTVLPVAGAPRQVDTQVYPVEVPPYNDTHVENVPLFQNNFEPESPDDAFCFMCEYGEHGARELSNPYYNQLHKIINRGASLPMGKLCRIIERYYNAKLKAHEEHGRPWTLRSIETHLVHHGGLSEEGRASILRNIHFSSVWHLVQHELLVKGETGTLCNLPALTAIRSATQQFMALSKKS